MYENLRKLSYKLPIEEYKARYQSRFNGESTIKLDFFIKENQAFVVVTPQMLQDIADIYKADKIVMQYHQKLPEIAIDKFAKKCLVDEIVLTNKIEGVRSTRREIGELLDELHEKSGSVKAKQRFIGLVRNYMFLSNMEQDERLVLNTCRDIREIYDALVLDDVVADDPKNAPDGKIFRKESVSVTAPTEKIVHQGIYPEEKIIENMNKALKILQDDSLPGLLRVVLFHYFFEYIHPFYDGNGRLGRYLLSYTIRNELEVLMSYRLSYTIYEHKHAYEEAFVICNDVKNKGDLTPFVLMMLSFIKQSAEKLVEALEKREHLINKYLAIIQILDLNKKEKELCFILLQASIFAENGISTQDLMEVLNIKQYSTLKKRLDILEKVQLLIKNSVGRENYYLLNLEMLDNKETI